MEVLVATTLIPPRMQAAWLPSLLSLLSLGPVESLIRVDGQWSPWSTVKSYCVDPKARQNLVTCGGGVETKYRSCTNPAPQGGGLSCQPLVLDDGTQIEGMRDSPCNENPCPLPNNFMWSEWSECSARCGRGEQRRYKMCGSVRLRLPGMIGCHQVISHTTTETPATIPPEQWPDNIVATTPGPAGAQSNSVDCTISDDTTADNVKATATNTQNEVRKILSSYTEYSFNCILVHLVHYESSPIQPNYSDHS